MQEQFNDRILTCVDCRADFIFTAGEQIFFFDKQFKNDPKRCKPCKSRRSGLAAVANGTGPVAAGLSRTETRTECSECGIETTVPFKPTQGRPVLCRQCFQMKGKAAAAVASIGANPAAVQMAQASVEADGSVLSPDAALVAATAAQAAPVDSSVATPEEIALVSEVLAAETGAGAATVDLIAQSPMEMIASSHAGSAERMAVEVQN